jgi:hypothetical protein
MNSPKTFFTNWRSIHLEMRPIISITPFAAVDRLSKPSLLAVIRRRGALLAISSIMPIAKIRCHGWAFYDLLTFQIDTLVAYSFGLDQAI